MTLTNNYTALICDDSEAVHESLCRFLSEEKINCISAFDGETALELFRQRRPDIIILDIMLPGISGTEVCSEIRKNSQVPILFLSAKGEEIDRVLGLELGADDYVTKPFSPREITIRIKRILSRSYGSKDIQDDIKFEELRIVPDMLEVSVSGQKINMTVREANLLTYLVTNARKVLNREQILKAVWGYQYYGDTRVVDAAIKRLRRKLPEENVNFKIETIYGIGYRLGSMHDQ